MLLFFADLRHAHPEFISDAVITTETLNLLFKYIITRTYTVQCQRTRGREEGEITGRMDKKEQAE